MEEVEEDKYLKDNSKIQLKFHLLFYYTVRGSYLNLSALYRDNLPAL